MRSPREVSVGVPSSSSIGGAASVEKPGHQHGMTLSPSGVDAMFRITRSEYYRRLFAVKRSAGCSPRRRWPKLVVERVEERIAPAVVLTDRPDYLPGDTALLLAVGFDA